jgi:tRNA threonylcarbamoyladenosine biosynthesis protein TsaE
MEITCARPEDMHAAAGDILQALGEIHIVLLDGDLGAGKTTLVQALCHALQTTELPTSPTFSLINEYSTPKGDPVYHMDMYRLNTPEEAMHIGVEDYLYSGRWCFVEWPSVIEGIVDPPFARVMIEVEGDEQRKIRILKYTRNAGQ